jgi:hypothetical protein
MAQCLLTEFVSHDRLAERVHELDVHQVRESLDERTKLALELARRFADDPMAAEREQTAMREGMSKVDREPFERSVTKLFAHGCPTRGHFCSAAPIMIGSSELQRRAACPVPLFGIGCV